MHSHQDTHAAGIHIYIGGIANNMCKKYHIYNNSIQFNLFGYNCVIRPCSTDIIRSIAAVRTHFERNFEIVFFSTVLYQCRSTNSCDRAG